MIKQIYSALAISAVLMLMLSILYSCIQEVTFSKVTIETNQVTSVTEATAICGGVISDDGGSNVTARGVCWSTSPNPTIENDTTINAVGAGPFASLIKGLSPSTTYFVRAYAVNKGGTGYGLQVTFTTKTFSITTTPISISLVTATSAIGGGNIISDGDSSTLTVKARGVCWNTFPSPTIENSKTLDGVGGGRFTSKIDSLTAFTTYYARAYATNGNGTIYGNEVLFTTSSGVIGLTTVAASSITSITAISGGAITSDGGATVTERGICWKISPSPSTADNKTINASGTGIFKATITGLAPSTTYYVRSYAINIVGTSYGNEISFTSSETITDFDGNVYNTVKIGTQTWMAENLRTTKYNDGTSIPFVSDSSSWLVLTTPGYCFYNNETANKSTYGALYNWYTVNTGKLAPTGWHVPTDTEWTELQNYLIANGYNYDGTTTGNNIAKSLAANTLWKTFTAVGSIGRDLSKNNTTGFAALPGSIRDYKSRFGEIGDQGSWWSSTEDKSTRGAWFRQLYYLISSVNRSTGQYRYGFSVRCVRDY
jgi:uncharacterized protein (TIGR02145 family)